MKRRFQSGKTFIGGILFVIPFLLNVAWAQEYLWPTDASRLMTSSFGEYRPGHFHAGLDIKTWGREGYQVFAIADGCVERIRVSPYGYGRAVYLQLDNGMVVVYAHLSRFNEQIQSIVKEEQERRGRFAVQKYFDPGRLIVKKGDVLGYTGSSGNGVPHLHIDVRDTLSRPFNPLMLGFPVKDSISPVIRKISVTPLDVESHVGGDGMPRIYETVRRRKGEYHLDEPVKAWGMLGIAVSAYDQAEGAWNRFAPYAMRLLVEDTLTFAVRFDRISFQKTDQVDLDRDYRLRRWGLGHFQKLYRDVGNTLNLYHSRAECGGILVSTGEILEDNPIAASRIDVLSDGSLHLPDGSHRFRIEAEDYFGNVSSLDGILEIVPHRKLRTSESPFEPENQTVTAVDSSLTLTHRLFEDYIRFGVSSTIPFSDRPYLVISWNGWEREHVPLRRIHPGLFAGVLAWNERDEGVLSAEAIYYPRFGEERVLRDTLHLFRIENEGGVVVSEDGRCRVAFSRGDIYRPIIGRCIQDTCSYPDGILETCYEMHPQDVPLKGDVEVSLMVPVYIGSIEKLGIYSLARDSSPGYIGGSWEDGMLHASVGSLGRYTVLRDTMPPVVLSIQPESDARIKDATPLIAVTFTDSLSGIGEEEDYRIWLDGKPLIVEYLPSKDWGIHPVETPLDAGDHIIDILIRDRAGNEIERQSRFTVIP